MARKVGLLLVGAGLLGLTLWWVQAEPNLAAGQASKAAQLPAEQAGESRAASLASNSSNLVRAEGSSASSWLTASPDTTPSLLASDAGGPYPAPTAKERERNAQLAKLGYMINEKYYQLSLSDLRAQAAKGDVQALTHLAERYLFALHGKPQEADFETGFDYREAARAALQQAYKGGNLHAAAMISESFLLEQRPIEATAWNEVASRSGDKLSADWFMTTTDYQKLSLEQKEQAQRQAELIWKKLKQARA